MEIKYLYNFKKPALFFKASDCIDPADFLNKNEFKPYREIWVASRFCKGFNKLNRKAYLIKLVDGDYPDSEMRGEGKTIPIEISEILEEYRKRGDEIRKNGVKDSFYSEIPLLSKEDALKTIIAALQSKGQKYGVSTPTVLVAYINIGFCSLANTDIQIIRDAVKHNKTPFQEIWILTNGVQEKNSIAKVYPEMTELFEYENIYIKEHLFELEKETINVFHQLDIFRKLTDIWNGNENLKDMDQTAILAIGKAFTNDLVISLGRICDKDTRSYGLVSFLNELKQDPRWLTRGYHTGLYPPVELDLLAANRTFDHLSGQGIDDYPLSKIDNDIRQIRETPCIDRIIGFRDQYIAHGDLDRTVDLLDLPTYQDLYDAFEFTEKIIQKYLMLLDAKSIRFTPTMQGNWEDPFMIPWIEKAEICED